MGPDAAQHHRAPGCGMSRSLRRPGRTPGTVNLGLAVAVLAVLLPLILNASASSPPTASEFSPNARQVIKQAPPGQAPEARAGGSTPSPTPGTSASPTASPTTTPRVDIPENEVKRCVGPAPLRQIEDPQSPPCIAYWKGDNGGATAKGVTRDSIYVAVPTPDGYTKQYEALERFFNTRFQLYGRKLVFQYCSPSAGADSQGSGDQARQTADAATAAAGCGNGIKPFASTFYQFNNGRYYNQQMACRYRTVTVASYTPYDSTYLNACAPYLFQYPMVAEEMFGQLGEWSCARLVGRKARWAAGSTAPGRPALSSADRRFGIFLAPYYADDPVARGAALRRLTDRLRACGAEVTPDRIIVNPVSETQPGQALDPTSANTAITKMKQADVSTVFCLCGIFAYGALARAAATNSYEPEWIGSTFGILDQYGGLVVSAAPASQLVRLFGLSFQPRWLHPALEPFNQAFQEGDPTLAPGTSSSEAVYFTQVYRPLLMLVSGIQMAGPRLTPEAFRDGLRRTRFPNPVTKLQAGDVGLTADGYSFTRDATEWWWSNTASGPYSDDAGGKGALCYVAGGARHRSGTWPRSEPGYFSGPCDSGRLS
jgi:hypothetical protein